MNGLVEHFEQHLGPIATGWSISADGNKLPFQIVRFNATPIEGAQVLATLGLSNRPLRVGQTEKRLRQELLMMFREFDGPRNLPMILQQVGLEALGKDQAYGVGDVLGPRGELRIGSTLEALFVALPVYFPDSFHVVRAEATEPIVIGWLVPISATEAEFVRRQGTARFENEMARLDPVVLDFERKAIV